MVINGFNFLYNKLWTVYKKMFDKLFMGIINTKIYNYLNIPLYNIENKYYWYGYVFKKSLRIVKGIIL